METTYTNNLNLALPAFGATDGWDDDWKRNANLIDVLLGQILNGNFVNSGCDIDFETGLAATLNPGQVIIQNTIEEVTETPLSFAPAPGGQEVIYFIYINSSGVNINSDVPSGDTYCLVASVTVNSTSVVRSTDLRYFPANKGVELVENEFLNPDFLHWQRLPSGSSFMQNALAKTYGPDRFCSLYANTQWGKDAILNVPNLVLQRYVAATELIFTQAVPFDYDSYGLYCPIGQKFYVQFDLKVPDNGIGFVPEITASFGQGLTAGAALTLLSSTLEFTRGEWATISAVLEVQSAPNPLDTCILFNMGGKYATATTQYITIKQTRCLRSDRNQLIHQKSYYQQLSECLRFYALGPGMSVIQIRNNEAKIEGVNSSFMQEMYRDPDITVGPFTDLDATGASVSSFGANYQGIQTVTMDQNVAANSRFIIYPIADAEIY